MSETGYIEPAKGTVRSSRTILFKSEYQVPEPPCRRSGSGMRNTPQLAFQRTPLWMRLLRVVPGRWRCRLIFVCFVPVCGAQVSSTPKSTESAAQNQLEVNWLYGAYIPKEAPVTPLNGEQRYRLFIRQSFTTPGIYIKTGFFAIHDQVENTPPEWGDGFEGFAKRVGTRQTQFLLQNSFTSLGNALVGWEPRYDRCKCDGFWPRTRQLSSEILLPMTVLKSICGHS
jgi:hypothetical protein